jgi:hypothetical protein
MCDIVITNELGLTAVSAAQAQRTLSDLGVKLLYNFQQSFGWPIYQGLFNLIRTYNVNLANYGEPAKTAIVILFMSATAGAFLLPLFIQANVGIPANALQSVEQLFPDVKMPPDLTPLLIVLAGGVALGLGYTVLRRHQKAK